MGVAVDLNRRDDLAGVRVPNDDLTLGRGHEPFDVGGKFEPGLETRNQLRPNEASPQTDEACLAGGLYKRLRSIGEVCFRSLHG
jgi:hypothetical protein